MVLEPVHPIVLVLGGTMSIQFGGALATTLFDDLGPAGTSMLRLTLATAMLFALWRPRWRGHAAADLRLAAVFGLALGAMNLCFYEALDRVPLGVVVTIEFIGPIGLATVLSRRRIDFACIALAVAGILLLARPWSSREAIDSTGLAFILAAALLWALYIVLAQRAGQAFNGGEGLAIAMVFAMLVPLVPGLIQGGSNLLRPSLLAAGLGVALLSSVVPYTLETEALRRLPARVFGVLMSLEPGVAALAGYLVLGQGLSPTDLAAIGLVVCASVGVTRTSVLAPEPAAALET